MKHLALFEMKKKKIISTAEFIVLYNLFFRNFKEFVRQSRISKKRLRILYCSGMNKIIKFKKLSYNF